MFVYEIKWKHKKLAQKQMKDKKGIKLLDMGRASFIAKKKSYHLHIIVAKQ